MVALAPCVMLSSIRRDELEVWHSAGIVKQAVDGNIHSEQRGRLADVGQHLPLSSMGQALRKQESTWRLLRCARNDIKKGLAIIPSVSLRGALSPSASLRTSLSKGDEAISGFVVQELQFTFLYPLPQGRGEATACTYVRSSVNSGQGPLLQ